MPIFFKENLRTLRKKKGITQEGLALQLDKARTTINNWEAGLGEPSMAEMEKIVQILDVSGYDLLFTDLSHVQVSKIDNTPKKRKNVQVNVLPNVQAITSTDPQSEQLSDPNSVPGSTPKHLEKIVEVLSLSVRGLEAANAVLINELKDCREQNIQLKREIPSINRGMENPGTKSVG